MRRRFLAVEPQIDRFGFNRPNNPLRPPVPAEEYGHRNFTLPFWIDLKVKLFSKTIVETPGFSAGGKAGVGEKGFDLLRRPRHHIRIDGDEIKPMPPRDQLSPIGHFNPARPAGQPPKMDNGRTPGMGFENLGPTPAGKGLEITGASPARYQRDESANKSELLHDASSSEIKR